MRDTDFLLFSISTYTHEAELPEALLSFSVEAISEMAEGKRHFIARIKKNKINASSGGDSPSLVCDEQQAQPISLNQSGSRIDRKPIGFVVNPG